MHTFKYEIREDDDGILYVAVPKDFKPEPEHWYMIYEMARYALNDLLIKNLKTQNLEEKSVLIIKEAEHTLSLISGEYGVILKEMNDSMKDIDDILNNGKEETD